MQTTLLGLGIAIILALAAALAAPYVVDWTDYRPIFEREASRLVGIPVRVSGSIEAKLLPVPAITLRGVQLGTADDPLLQARELGVELSLAPLLRGEWRATEVRLIGPEIAVGLDRAGRLERAGASFGLDPDTLAIERLAIEDGHIILTDAGSASRLELLNVWFNGDVRSLVGPAKGEGGFIAQGERHSYRLNAGRAADDGSLRLRLAVDAADRPLSTEAEGTLRFEQGMPRFEGTLAVSRLAGVGLVDGRAVASEPWRATAKVKAGSGSALFEQLELQYGAEERAMKLAGTAELRFGARPRLDALLSARQLDLDRLIALPEPTKGLPLVALRAAAELFRDSLQPPLPVRLGIGLDTVTLAGATLQAVRGDFKFDGNGWELETVEARTPGFAQLRASGRLTLTPQGASFTGPAAIEATDPRGLVAWLEGRPEPAPGQLAPLRASGDLTLAADRVAIDRLKAEVDRKPIAGRLTYGWRSDGRPRLDAELNAADLDIDAAVAFVRKALPDALLAAPATMTLGLDIGRATLAGIEAKNAKARLNIDDSGVAIERLSIGDLQGAAVDLRGRIEEPWTHPRGMLTLDLDGRGFDGVNAVADRLAPSMAGPLRTVTARLGPAKLRATLTVDRAQLAPAHTTATLRVEGRVGAMRIALTADATGDPAAPDNADLRSETRIDAEDGQALAALLGLDRIATVDKRAGSLRLTAVGPLAAVRLDGRMTAGGLDIAVAGTGTALGGAVSGSGDLSVTAADASAVRALPGRPAKAVPVAFKTRVVIDKDRVAAETLTGTVAGTAIDGRLAVTLGRHARVEGRLNADLIDGTTLLAALLGLPPQAATAAAGTPWDVDPFTRGVAADLVGQIELRATRAAFGPALDVRQLQALVRMAPGEIAFEDVTGVIAGGRLQASLTGQSGAEGLSASLRLALIGADLQAALPSSARAPLSGQFSLQLEAKGTGRSPAALIGALEGAGTIAVEDAQVAGLDAKAFDTVTRAADQGLSLDAAHIREVTERALDSGRLSLPRAEGAYTITAGQLRLRSMIAPGDRADLGLSAGIDLSQWLLDARVTLVGADATSVPAAGRPEVYVGLKGPVMTPKRSVDVSALTGWLTLRAVDVQAKRLESVEAERRAALEAASRVAAEAERRTAAEAAARAAAEAQRRAAAEAAARAAAPPARVEPGPPADMPDPPAAPPRRAPPVSEQAPPLPPPIDIRPLPGARRSDLRRPLARAAARPNATGLRPAVAVPLRRVWPATQPQRG